MKRIFALLLCVTIIFALSGCTLLTKVQQTNEAVKKPTTVSDTATTKDIHEYIASNQSSYDKLAEDLKYVMKFEVEARGNSLVYKYTYQMDIGDIESLKQSFESQYDSLKIQVKNDLSKFKKAVSDAESLFIEYYNVDGRLITSMEFK